LTGEFVEESDDEEQEEGWRGMGELYSDAEVARRYRNARAECFTDLMANDIMSLFGPPTGRGRTAQDDEDDDDEEEEEEEEGSTDCGSEEEDYYPPHESAMGGELYRAIYHQLQTDIEREEELRRPGRIPSSSRFGDSVHSARPPSPPHRFLTDPREVRSQFASSSQTHTCPHQGMGRVSDEVD
jgi:hypothetical protein